MRKILSVLLSVFTLCVIAVGFSSCSLLMPYHEHFQCQRGNDSGYCGPIDKVYQESVIEQQKEGGQSW